MSQRKSFKVVIVVDRGYKVRDVYKGVYYAENRAKLYEQIYSQYGCNLREFYAESVGCVDQASS